MAIYYSQNARQTENIGAALACALPYGAVVAMFGELGAGKTAFVRGFAGGMGIDADVTSPTFALVNEYRSGEKKLCHFDMYRISTWDDLYSTGYFDYIDEGVAMIIEWSENIEAVLPEDCIKVTIDKTENPLERKIEIIGAEILENISD